MNRAQLDVRVIRVDAGDDIEVARILLHEYLSMQVSNYPDPGEAERRFQAEVDDLPGRYRPPAGAFFIACVGGQAAGCIGMAPLEDGIAELRRLYVRDPYRRSGIGRVLTEALIGAARESGYSALRLDTHVSRLPALALYRSMGFEEIEAYEYSSVFDLVYLELDLEA